MIFNVRNKLYAYIQFRQDRWQSVGTFTDTIYIIIPQKRGLMKMLYQVYFSISHIKSSTKIICISQILVINGFPLSPFETT